MVELLPVPLPIVESVVLVLPDVPEELPLRLRLLRERVVVELLLLFVSLFWSIVVLDCPVCDALDWPLGSVLVVLAPEPEL